MAFTLTAEEREQFLAGVHIGIVAVERKERAPLAVPVWYDYTPHGEVLIWTTRDTVKDKAIRKAGRFSLAVQSEGHPPKYVTAEGPVTGVDESPTRAQVLSITRRYLSSAEAEAFVEQEHGSHSVLIRMRPSKWLGADQGERNPG
ncbi:pyridoxamine 5'-phosphate oxidase family protein [Nocardia sp. NPDC049149]|uniref:pyridoxamine 5'-phosphate oxidase family protein n=1 Tax=Nocardia sp. NPDC049149 TaxID=3364315 RepID=UPI003723C0AA